MILSVTDSFCSPNPDREGEKKKKDNQGSSICLTFIKNLLTLVLASHLDEGFLSLFCSSGAISSLNSHSGLNYTFKARKDASPSHNNVPSCQLHRRIEGPGSMDSATFHEALAEQDGPYGPGNTGLSEHRGKYNLLRSLNLSVWVTNTCKEPLFPMRESLLGMGSMQVALQ